MYRRGFVYSLLCLVVCSATGNAQKTAFQPSAARLEEQKLRMTGERLLAECTVALDPPAKLKVEEVAAAIGTCNGYIAGAEDGKFTQWMMAERCGSGCSPFVENGFFCKTPEDITEDVRLVIQWLQSHPKDRELPAATVVQFALRDAYPCDSNQSQTSSPPSIKQPSSDLTPKQVSGPPSPSVSAIIKQAQGELLQGNLIEAYAWTALATTGDLTPTEKANLQLSVDSIGSRLSKSKLRKAKERALELQKQYPQTPPRN